MDVPGLPLVQAGSLLRKSQMRADSERPRGSQAQQCIKSLVWPCKQRRAAEVGYLMSIKRPTSRNHRVRHGLGGTPTYRTWYSMIDRCINPANASYPAYGGKGISVCEHWEKLANFVEDMGIRPYGKTLDRIDPTGNYEPSNCRWAGLLDQQRNRSSVKCSMETADQVRALSHEGARQREIAARVGLSQSVVCRIINGQAWRRHVES